MPSSTEQRYLSFNSNLCRSAEQNLAIEEVIQEQWRTVLGELIAQLDRPDAVNSVLTTLHPDVTRQIECRAMAAAMTVTDFVAGAIREFLESADDDLWFQLLTIIRKSDDPGLSAMQTILKWVVTER